MQSNHREVMLDTLAECRLTAAIVKLKVGRSSQEFNALTSLIRAVDAVADELTGETNYLRRADDDRTFA